MVGKDHQLSKSHLEWLVRIISSIGHKLMLDENDATHVMQGDQLLIEVMGHCTAP